MIDASYHIHYCEPNDAWPKGAWSVYQINGDQIAERIVREEVVSAKDATFGVPYYQGPVIARHSWCGFLGMWDSLQGATDAIQKNLADQKAQDAKLASRAKPRSGQPRT